MTGNPISVEPAAAASPAEQPIFAAVIWPHRSLGERSFRLVMTLLCLVTLASSVPFVLFGAWPVAGFFGLDLLALYIAFRLNFRDARGREEVAVSPLKVMLARIDPAGRRREWRFDTLWTRLDRRHDDEFGLLGLALVSRGRSVAVGDALSPGERESFAGELSAALATAKRGPRYDV